MVYLSEAVQAVKNDETGETVFVARSIGGSREFGVRRSLDDGVIVYDYTTQRPLVQLPLWAAIGKVWEELLPALSFYDAFEQAGPEDKIRRKGWNSGVAIGFTGDVLYLCQRFENGKGWKILSGGIPLKRGDLTAEDWYIVK